MNRLGITRNKKNLTLNRSSGIKSIPRKHISLAAMALVLICLKLIVVPIEASSPKIIRARTFPASGKISISGAWALYPLVVRWAEEFQKENREIKIDLQAGGAGKGMADVLNGLVDIGMVSREVYPEEISRGAVPLSVARDAVVGTLNKNNPHLRTILRKGLDQEVLKAIFVEGKIKYWEEIFGYPGKTPIHVYTRSDACGAAETWAAFLGAHQEDLKGIAIYGDPGLAEAVRRDPLALGFNNLNFAYNPKSLEPHQGLAIVPLDLNHNGQLEPEENFYPNRNQLTAAISRGLYPSPPARNLYLVIKVAPSNPLSILFLEWVLNRGQELVEEVGYLRLDDLTIQKEKQKIKELKEKRGDRN
ncbi:MAG: PstS family phosphate ABC transporter substrate-binding protein [Candidatus Saccharicenans sp.]